MGRLFLEYLDGPCYRCRRCQAHLAKVKDLMSKVRRQSLPDCCHAAHATHNVSTPTRQEFHCANGRAFLFDTACNVRAGVAEERPMTTGLHVVADVSCISCAVIVGWVYVRALAPRAHRLWLWLSSLSAADQAKATGAPTD